MRIDIDDDIHNGTMTAPHGLIRTDTGERLDASRYVMVDDETGEYVRYADRGLPGYIPIGDDGEPIIESGVFPFPVKLVPIAGGSQLENLDPKTSRT